MNRLKQMLLTGVAAGSMLWAAPSFAVETNETAHVPAITQTYTAQAKEKAPIQLCGIEKDKEELWNFYQRLGQTAEGRKVQASLEEAYARTGQKVPLRFGFLEKGYGAVYQGLMQGITINSNYQAADEVVLAHELMHDVQAKREINKDVLVYDNLKDVFIAGKLLELETKIQDTVMADQKNLTPRGEDLNTAFLPLYRDFKADGMKKFNGDETKAVRYAKTELAKTLWEDKNMPLYQIPLNLFSRNETGKVYRAVGSWNIAYDQQSVCNMMSDIKSIRFQKGNKEADRLFTQFAEKMGVDLSAEYFKENMDDGWGISVSENDVKMAQSRLTLKEDAKGQLIASVFEQDTKIVENIFNQSGQCLSAKVFSEDGKTIIKDGNVALGLAETHYTNEGVRTMEIAQDGKRTTYYPNQQIHKQMDEKGEVLAYFAPDGQALNPEKAYQNGKEGVFYEYAQDGTLERQTSYKNGKKNGKEIRGKDWTTYKNGLKDGVEHTETRIWGAVRTEDVSWKAGVRHGDAYRNGKPDCYYHHGKMYWSREEYEATKETLKKTLKEKSASATPQLAGSLLKKVSVER